MGHSVDSERDNPGETNSTNDSEEDESNKTVTEKEKSKGGDSLQWDDMLDDRPTHSSTPGVVTVAQKNVKIVITSDTGSPFKDRGDKDMEKAGLPLAVSVLTRRKVKEAKVQWLRSTFERLLRGSY